jgi:GNAT superfamily N-acetyltransferase
MTTHSEDSRVAFHLACRHDVPDIVVLAREQLPDMTYLHDETSWRTYHRFGDGSHARDNYLIVTRAEGSDQLLGFLWADAAPYQDYGVIEPWWCLNALAVAEHAQGKGLGRLMVSSAWSRAEASGVVSVYGTSYPQSAEFWARCGFAVASEKERLGADRLVRFANGSRKHLEMTAERGNRWFVRSRASGDEAAARMKVIDKDAL